MSRLLTQLHRLYGMGDRPTAAAATAAQPITLVDDQGQVRAAVLTLGQPADWSLLSLVWQGVQADLGLPAPAIAVNGQDAYQLWFSLQTPVHASHAAAFMEALRVRYLPDVPQHRVHIKLAEAQLPPLLVQDDQWAAFLAPDLAPVFSDTPWLDLPPNPEGQADLLSKVASITSSDLDAAMHRLMGAQQGEAAQKASHGESPRQFLLNVMNNEAVALHLRIEAAKALLPFESGR